MNLSEMIQAIFIMVIVSLMATEVLDLVLTLATAVMTMP